MAAHTTRNRGGFVIMILGVLLIAALGIGWVVWSGGVSPSADVTDLSLRVPTPPNLPQPAPMPEPQPLPVPTPQPPTPG
jgi:hypothetical protein